jgi:Ca2+-binding RTX toxin-like protein
MSFGLGSLVIRADDGSELHLTDFDPNDVYAFDTIQRFLFADGVELSYAEFVSRGFDIEGAVGDDQLTGTNISDRMLGLEGDDTLSGGEGDDMLTGGTGNDTLQGGAGDDTYAFELGDGVDTLIDATSAGENRVRFGAGIAAADLKITGDSRALIIEIGAAGDALVLQHSDTQEGDMSRVITELEFADGSTVRLAELLPDGDFPDPILGTAADDVLVGSKLDDTIDAGAGNDIIVALGGNDTLTGGSGRDLLLGGKGDDTFILFGSDSQDDLFFGGPGNDRIVGGSDDAVIRLNRFGVGNGVELIDGGAGRNHIAGTASADHINLSATTVVNIERVDAGAGDDLIEGTDGADRMVGGSGDDRLQGGSGDDSYLFTRGDGQDHILDTGSSAGDSVEMDELIRHDQLWLSRHDTDLRIAVIGTGDAVVVDRWYQAAEHRVEWLRAGDGYQLSDANVDRLVQAMAAFSPPAAGELDLSPNLMAELEPVLAAAWQAA